MCGRENLETGSVEGRTWRQAVCGRENLETGSVRKGELGDRQCEEGRTWRQAV